MMDASLYMHLVGGALTFYMLLVAVRCGPTRLLSRITRRAAHERALQPGVPVWAMIKAVAVVA